MNRLSLAARIAGMAVVSFAVLATAQQTRFGVVADFGSGANAAAVASRMVSLNPDFIATAGDNTYSTANTTANWDSVFGARYSQYIAYPAGSTSAYAGNGVTTNRFFPAIGNHDMDVGNSPASFTNHLALPGNERYYTTVQGTGSATVQLFVLSSDPREPDGTGINSTQANWFRNAIAQSTARWQVVIFHHPAYSSTTTSHSASTYMRWGFENLGVDMVFQGHNHHMEQINVGSLPYFVTGAGGRSHYTFSGAPAASSVFRNSTDYGFSFVTATASTLTHQFITANGTVLSTYAIPTPGAAALLGIAGLAATRRRR